MLSFFNKKKLINLTKQKFFKSSILKYNFFTIYGSLFKKKGNYIFSKNEVLNQLSDYVIQYKRLN